MCECVPEFWDWENKAGVFKMENKILNIRTPYGDTYKINSSGFISTSGVKPSENWIMLGLMPVRCWRLYNLIPFNKITPEWLKTHEFLYKNGNPRYTVIDRDYGTIRCWGNTKVHGILFLWFDDD
jgi:hypothetical protein